MDFIPAVDWDLAEVDLSGGYKGQCLHTGESCPVVATKVPRPITGIQPNEIVDQAIPASRLSHLGSLKVGAIPL